MNQTEESSPQQAIRLFPKQRNLLQHQNNQINEENFQTQQQLLNNKNPVVKVIWQKSSNQSLKVSSNSNNNNLSNGQLQTIQTKRPRLVQLTNNNNVNVNNTNTNNVNVNNTNTNNNLNTSNGTNNSVQQEQQQQQKKEEENPQKSDKNLKKQKMLKLNQDRPFVTTNDILNNKKQVCLQKILEQTGAKELSQIKKLNLKKQNLFVFEPDYPLQNLQIINLTNNSLVNIMSFSKFPSLKEIILDNNFIDDLQPLEDLTKIVKLKVSSNRITSIKPLQKQSLLQYLDISFNKIDDFDKALETLQEMPSLAELIFENNPATIRFSYKYDVLWALRLVKFDNEVVTEKEYQVSKDFNMIKEKPNQKNQNINCSIEMNPDLTQRPTTSHNRQPSVRKFNEQSLKSKELERKLEEIERSHAEMKEQLDKTLREKEQLEEQNEETQADLDQMTFRVEELEKENEELKFETSFNIDLQKENLDLRRKVAAYEQTIIFKDSDQGEMQQQIYFLYKKQEDLEYQNKQLLQEIAKLKQSQLNEQQQ